jgi:UDP-glucose 4-epimerase
VVALAVQGKKESVTVFGSDYDTKDGTGVRDYVHVMVSFANYVVRLYGEVRRIKIW